MKSTPYHTCVVKKFICSLFIFISCIRIKEVNKKGKDENFDT